MIIERALKKLKPELKSVVLMTYYEGHEPSRNCKKIEYLANAGESPPAQGAGIFCIGRSRLSWPFRLSDVCTALVCVYRCLFIWCAVWQLSKRRWSAFFKRRVDCLARFTLPALQYTA